MASVAAPPQHAIELDTIATEWQWALDAADDALLDSGRALPPGEAARRRRDLLHEREETATTLASFARIADVRPKPWLPPLRVTTTMLGVPAGTRACLFDLDGVLTTSATLHAAAWADVFDDVLLRLSERAGWHFVPFDPVDDYQSFLDGRTRLEGIDAFLASRGIRLPEGRPEDPPEADSIHGLAKRKRDALARGLHAQGIAALPGARRYLQAAGHAGIGRAVVSSSSSTLPMLDLAGLAALVERRVDAEVIRVEHLRSRPAPDILLGACRSLGIRPEHAVTFTHSPAGVVAGNAAGLTVVGVAPPAQADELQGFGATRVARSLADLLDRRLIREAS